MVSRMSWPRIGTCPYQAEAGRPGGQYVAEPFFFLLKRRLVRGAFMILLGASGVLVWLGRAGCGDGLFHHHACAASAFEP